MFFLAIFRNLSKYSISSLVDFFPPSSFYPLLESTISKKTQIIAEILGNYALYFSKNNISLYDFAIDLRQYFLLGFNQLSYPLIICLESDNQLMKHVFDSHFLIMHYLMLQSDDELVILASLELIQFQLRVNMSPDTINAPAICALFSHKFSAVSIMAVRIVSEHIHLFLERVFDVVDQLVDVTLSGPFIARCFSVKCLCQVPDNHFGLLSNKEFIDALVDIIRESEHDQDFHRHALSLLSSLVQYWSMNGTLEIHLKMIDVMSLVQVIYESSADVDVILLEYLYSEKPQTIIE